MKPKPKTKKLPSERKRTIPVELDINLLSDIDKRARKNYLTLKEQIEDIIRRSMISYGKGKPKPHEPEVEKIVKMFSRKKRGRKAKN
jgi:hypothetical protein